MIALLMSDIVSLVVIYKLLSACRRFWMIYEIVFTVKYSGYSMRMLLMIVIAFWI